jgi:hypothetical protein
VKTNRSKGQSLVEYALGIGAITALCMVALASTGHMSGHIIKNVVNSFNSSEQAAHPEEEVNLQAQPWILQ